MVYYQALKGGKRTMKWKRSGYRDITSYPSFCIKLFGLCGADSVTFTFL